MKGFTPPIIDPKNGKVQIDALALLRMLKHVKDQELSGVTGTIVGSIQQTQDSQLQQQQQQQQQHSRKDSQHNQEAKDSHSKQWNFFVSDVVPLPHQKTDIFQSKMLGIRQQMGLETTPIGWYQSSPNSSFNSEQVLTNFFNFYKNYRLPCICIFFDQGVSQINIKAIKAFTTSPKLLKLYQQKHKAALHQQQNPGALENLKLYQFQLYREGIRTAQDLLDQIPIKIKRSYLMQAFLADHVHTKIILGGGELPITNQFMKSGIGSQDISQILGTEQNDTTFRASSLNSNDSAATTVNQQMLSGEIHDDVKQKVSYLEKIIQLTNSAADSFTHVGHEMQKHTEISLQKNMQQKVNKTDFLNSASQMDYLVGLVKQYTECNSIIDNI